MAYLDTDEINNSGRVQFLEKSLDEAGLQVIGIQEGRIAESQRRSGYIYEMLVAGAEGGCYGSQVWVKRAPGVRIVAWRVWDH